MRQHRECFSLEIGDHGGHSWPRLRPNILEVAPSGEDPTRYEGELVYSPGEDHDIVGRAIKAQIPTEKVVLIYTTGTEVYRSPWENWKSK